jgi:hypothetical protein
MVVTDLVMRFPWAGVWTALADFDQRQDSLSGAATIDVGGVTFSGVFVAEMTGSFQQRSRAFIVGGAGGWRNVIAAKHYHSDSGVSRKTVAQDVAAIAGETLASVDLSGVLGIDHVRAMGPAGLAMTEACGSTAWWIGADGRATVGTRPRVDAGEHQVLEYDPRFKVATVAANDVSLVTVGSVLRSQLVTPLLVKEIEFKANGKQLRLTCWGEELSA